MARLLLLFVACSVTVPVQAADPPPPLAERFLHEGRFADGETASLLALDANPKADETRFGLGVIQFVRAVENLGKAMYEYGAVSEKAKPSGRSSAYMPGIRSTASRSPPYTSANSAAHCALLVMSAKLPGTGRCSSRRNSV